MIAGNMHLVDVQILVWEQEIKLHKVILISFISGMIFNWIIRIYMRSYGRFRNSIWRKPKQLKQ